MKSISVILALLMLFAVNAGAQDEIPADLGIQTPLLGVTAIDSIDVEIVEPNAAEGGAMEMQRFFTTALIERINDCGDQVKVTFFKWIKSNDLLPARKEVNAKSLTILVWSKDKNGIFEARYLLNEAPPYLRVSLDYFDLSGQKLALETINRLIEDYEIGQLWDSLFEAIQCENQ